MTEPYKIRASSWASLFDCAHRWEGQHLMGLKSPYSPRAMLGTAVHASTAAFDQGRLDQSGITADDAAGLLVDTLRESKDQVDWNAEDKLTMGEAEKIGLTLHVMYCTNISPRYDFAFVEMETRPLVIDCGHDIHIELTGTLDRSRIVKKSNGVGISDLKTGAQAVQKGAAKTKGHAPQLGTYEMLYAHTTGQTPTEDGEIIGLKTSGKQEIATGTIKNARQQMVGDADSPGLIEYAREFFRTGLFPPNPTSFMCSEKYCARYNLCKFHD